MKFPLTRSIVSLGLALGALSCLPAANAAPVEYTFVAEPDPGSSLTQSFSGSFSYDDTSTPGTGFAGEDVFVLTGFSFNFNGVAYTLSDLSYGGAVFEAGDFKGLDAAGPVFTLLQDFGLGGPSFTYEFVSGTIDPGAGVLTYQLVTNSVPEPGTAGLLAVALLGIAGLRRSR